MYTVMTGRIVVKCLHHIYCILPRRYFSDVSPIFADVSCLINVNQMFSWKTSVRMIPMPCSGPDDAYVVSAVMQLIQSEAGGANPQNHQKFMVETIAEFWIYSVVLPTCFQTLLSFWE